MPAYNAAQYIRDAIRSVQLQSDRDWELVVVDDMSSDSTLEIARNAALSDSRIRVFQNTKQSGPGPTRNRAIDEGRGRYLAFLDADDQWLPEKLSKQLELMRDRSVVLSFAPYEVVRNDGARSGQIVDAKAPLQIGYNQLLRKEATVGCLTVVIDRQLAGKVRMPDIKRGQDYACWLEILKRGGTAARCADVLGLYRLTPGSISRNKFRKAWYQWRIYRDSEKLNVLTSIWLLAHYAFRAIVRR